MTYPPGVNAYADEVAEEKRTESLVSATVQGKETKFHEPLNEY